MGLTIKGLGAIIPDYYKQKREAEARIGRTLSIREFEQRYLKRSGGGQLNDTGTSVFSPCLCELDYSWYTAPGDDILDPFAGGSVRGIVASIMGRNYTGIDIRSEQIDANNENAASICDKMPEWICGDSARLHELVDDRMFDHIFTCPPYGSLEVYSDNPADISNMTQENFDATYKQILAAAVDRLKDDRFATIVVGNYRDKHGYMIDLVGLTISAMEDARCRYYNDLIYMTPAGSLPIRVAKQFSSTRKIGKMHQYVLNFVKGDPAKATSRLGDVIIPEF
jgi:DNA modification methylase